MNSKKALAYILLAILVAVPGTVARLAEIHLAPVQMALVAGIAVLGAAFLLLWACDTAQMEVSQGLALAAVALIGVLPEYAVDMYFTWQAGRFPEGGYAHYAIANMTGANRLIIGVGWALIVLICWLKTRRGVRLQPARRTEVLFLGLATLYAFFVSLKGSLVWYDGVVFVCLYGWYVGIASLQPQADHVAEGPAELLAALPQRKRRGAIVALFLLAAGAILANAEPFCEGLIASGKQLGVDEFLLVQWLAPLASEAPEFVLATMFALRGSPGLALGSLLSAKVNQWTLLVGTIPGVYALSSGSFVPPIPMGSFQMNEILLTAAQSLLAVAMLASLRLSVGQGLLLFALFAAQLVSPAVKFAGAWNLSDEHVLQLFSALYLVAAITLFAQNPGRILSLWRGLGRGQPRQS